METPENLTAVEDDTLTTELAKSFAISAAATVGMLTAGAAYSGVKNALAARKARKAAETDDTDVE